MEGHSRFRTSGGIAAGKTHQEFVQMHMRQACGIQGIAQIETFLRVGSSNANK
jgi:hypothetical protein